MGSSEFQQKFEIEDMEFLQNSLPIKSVTGMEVFNLGCVGVSERLLWFKFVLDVVSLHAGVNSDVALRP